MKVRDLSPEILRKKNKSRTLIKLWKKLEWERLYKYEILGEEVKGGGPGKRAPKLNGSKIENALINAWKRESMSKKVRMFDLAKKIKMVKVVKC